MINRPISLCLFKDEEQEEVLTKRQKFKLKIEELVFYLLVFMLTLVLFLILKPYYKVSSSNLRDGVMAQSMLVVLLGVVGVVGLKFSVFGKLDRKTTVYLIFIVGVLMRIFYMLYTPITVRQHDTYNSSNTGHEAYAWTIFSTGKFPTTNSYQFYHPPLNAILQASFMRFMEWLTDGLTSIFNLGDYFPMSFQHNYYSKLPDGSQQRFFLYSTTQILAVLYSVITAVYLLKIVKLFGFKGKNSVLLSAMVVLFPRLYQFAGMVNNDALSLMFSILALYTALKWQKQGKKLINILFCGLFCGLGMMTKLASATVCLPIAGIFIYEFIVEVIEVIKEIKAKSKIDWKKRLNLPVQFVLFLVICAPIGLWFQFYAFQKFGQPFGFVFGAEGSGSYLNSLLKTDHHSLFERLVVAFDLNEYFGNIFCIPFANAVKEGNKIVSYNSYNTYNLFNYQVRSAIFGEFTLKQGEGFAVLSLLSAFIFCILLAIGVFYSVVKFIKCYIKKDAFFKENSIISLRDFIFIFLLLQSQVIPEILFYIKMPYACTQDFRYVMPIIPALALITVYVNKILVLSGNQKTIFLSRAITTTSVVTIFSSLILYCVCI